MPDALPITVTAHADRTLTLSLPPSAPDARELLDEVVCRYRGCFDRDGFDLLPIGVSRDEAEARIVECAARLGLRVRFLDVAADPHCYSCLGTGRIVGFGRDGLPCPCASHCEECGEPIAYEPREERPRVCVWCEHEAASNVEPADAPEAFAAFRAATIAQGGAT